MSPRQSSCFTENAQGPVFGLGPRTQPAADLHLLQARINIFGCTHNRDIAQ